MNLQQVYRQGDVLIVRIDTMPKDVKAEKKSDRVVLAYGEVTGHAHAIDQREVKAFAPTKPARIFDAKVERFLQVTTKALLKHEEHSTIELPAGDYAVIQQREYHPEEIRRVAD